MNKRAVEEYTEKLVMPIIEENQFELVDVEYVKEGANWYLRVYVDKENGINIDDCVLVSRALEEKLDAEDFISEKDFIRNLGKKVEVKLYKEMDGFKEFEAVLDACDKEQLTFCFENEEQRTYNLKEIAMIRLAFE